MQIDYYLQNIENLDDYLKHLRKVSKESESTRRGQKMVFNSLTGIFYDSIKDAHASANLSCTVGELGKMLRGVVKNKTNFVLCNKSAQ